ncbi:LuxR C-terminal-related transcriptional regulator [Nocardioides caldifontis]|uniref:LuxR C-terminal-related transcriptional regulator n=1 Tax=Nocardioides caldifontis TaxID=2588938 RepID=UPI0011DF479E|nr:LuxR C-terminal-related transcriptional regulator [Nocardioides caldifontis]
MTVLVLTTKLFAPARRESTVQRPSVLRLLDATLRPGNRLTLVAAPAGFGKSTLLAEWTVAAREAGTHVAWLSLDEGDNDLTRLLTHLVAALDAKSDSIERLRDGIPAAMTVLVNDLADRPQTVLVLDDYHVLTAPVVHEAMTFLVDHAPESLHLVVATRADPPLPLARLRSRGQLTELRAKELRFTTEEAGQLLQDLELADSDVRALTDRTEGWAAGLQLAALALRGAEPDNASAFVEDFTGSNRFVLDYLADEVLARQPEATRDFLLRTAVLDRLTGPLCDAVTKVPDAKGTLDQLDRDNLFLIPLDDRRGWYRYHHLFADVLRARLLADHPDEVPTLHRRASDWYADAGLVEEAVRHALLAEDVDRAAYLIEQAVPEMRRARRDALLMSWARALPDDVVRRSPVLSIVSGWAHLMVGDLGGLEARLDDAEAALAAGDKDPALKARWADTEDLRTAPAHIAVYRASLAQARGDVPGTVQHARRAVQLAAPDDHFVRGAGGGFLGLAAWAAGDVEEALTTFTDAVHHLEAAGNHIDALDATIVLADLQVAAGRPGRARQLYETALRTAARMGEPPPRAAADLHVGLAELATELDDLPTAEAHLEQARQLGEHGSITENRHRWFVASAWLRAAQSDYAKAVALLEEAEAVYRHGFYPDVRPIAAMKARVQIRAGELDAAGAWAEGRSSEPEFLREYDHLTLARLLLARKEDALPLVTRLEEAAARRAGSLREVRVLKALAHQANGDRAEARAALLASFDTPEPDSAVRLYLDEGRPMVELLHDLDHPHARRLLAKAHAQRPLAEPLSPRELEVLRLLESELTGPEIARTLYVSLNTLRTHTKRIFTKLQVTTRAAAVRQAHERGLL